MMNLGEKIDSYFGPIEDILLRLPNHGLSDAHLTRQFTNGLFPPQLKAYVKEVLPANLVAAYQLKSQIVGGGTLY